MSEDELLEENENLRRANLYVVDEFNQLKEDYDRLISLNRQAAEVVEAVLQELLLKSKAHGYYSYETYAGYVSECCNCGAKTIGIDCEHEKGCDQAEYENLKLVTFDQLERVVKHLKE